MDITYKQIEDANKATNSTDVKGKDYIEVNQRVKAFRMVYPTGFISTQLVSNENGVAIFKAECGYFEESLPIVLATGTAYEKEGSTFINKTSYIENCETSAVGRCLGMAGFGIDASIASKEEVENAKANQNKKAKPAAKPKKASKEQIRLIADNIEQKDKLLEYYEVKQLADLTEAQAKKIIDSKKLVEKDKNRTKEETDDK